MMSRIAYINKFVIPRLIESGRFGKNCEINYKIDESRLGVDHYASVVLFVDLFIKSVFGERNIKVVMKFQSEEQIIWDVYRRKEQFQNELVMYSEIFPKIDKDNIMKELVCEFYGGIAESGEDLFKDFIVLEDLSGLGFRLSTDKVFLDYDHCILAMKAIGKFHGLSYAAKKKHLDGFLDAVSKLQFKWEDHFINEWADMLEINGKRGILPLIEKNKSSEFLNKVLKNYKDPVRLIKSLIEPEEPEAVLCHGDFNRNNVLYRYDKNGRPDSIKLFDFQTPMYASPVTDITFFLYMNTTKELRDKYWDDLLTAYYDSIHSVIPDFTIPNMNFKKYSFYAYIICSFFLPCVISGENIDFQKILTLKPHDQAVLFSKMGGEKGTQALVDVVEHFIENDYIQASYY